MERQRGELTRHLKPLKESTFSDFEVLQAMIRADIDPEEIASVTQLRGSRSGVIRVAMRTRHSVGKLDELVRKKKLCIGQVALGEVRECGQFVKVILENVPLYVSDSAVEEEMSKYGNVISSEKEYQDFEGCRIANEKRTVLFSNLFGQMSLDKKQVIIQGNVAFANVVQARSHDARADPSYEQILDKVIRQLTACQRRSYATSPTEADDFQLEPEVLAYLQRRSSVKVRGEKRRNTTTMSTVALRQSNVVRDVGDEISNDAHEIFNWKDSRNIFRMRNENKPGTEHKFGKKLDSSDEIENKVGQLKEFSIQKLSKPLHRSSRCTEKTLPLKLEPLKNEKIENSRNAGKSEVKKVGILKQPKLGLAQKVKSCNEAFSSFLEQRKRQKRNEAFLQLSANLL